MRTPWGALAFHFSALHHTNLEVLARSARRAEGKSARQEVTVDSECQYGDNIQNYAFPISTAPPY